MQFYLFTILSVVQLVAGSSKLLTFCLCCEKRTFVQRLAQEMGSQDFEEWADCRA